METFFQDLTDSLSRAINSYGNIILWGDFNITIKKENSITYNQLEEFCDTFNLTNLVNSKTCFVNKHKSTIDLILINNLRSFQITNVTETGVSDCHKLITTFMKYYISRLRQKNVHYRSYKNFNEEKFLSGVEEVDFSFKTSNSEENYSVLRNVFSNIVNIHAPLQKKILRGNDASFMNKELRKEIYTRSSFGNRYFKNSTKENETSYKKERNKGVSLRRKSLRQHFSENFSKNTLIILFNIKKIITFIITLKSIPAKLTGFSNIHITPLDTKNNFKRNNKHKKKTIRY